MRIAHIINPVIVGESSDLFVAQPITFETMRIAQEFARGHVDVALYSAQYPEDRSIVPEWFQITPDLDRSIFEIRSFYKKRKLPLIKDILDRLYDASDADYFIYTNVDIALMPHFYVAVNKIIETGYDAFVINRRTISQEYTNVDQLYLMFSQAGEKHPGYDCFVFKRDFYPGFNTGAACVGANWIGRVLITNLICHSTKFDVFEDLHLTFHIGDDRNWKVQIYKDYDKHNENELHNILLEYKSHNLLQDKPLVESFLQQIESPDSSPTPKPHKSKLPPLSLIEAKLKKLINRIL
ncbi:MAG: hypothetical protein JRD93_05425 [Deltaproteobacteria bacterium]|nr:hypothetical protein [Deltaproteobacteria bacterium]